MNSLSKFSLAIAFSTALFCLLMLGKGFAANTQPRDHYIFMGQDRAGKVILSMEIERDAAAAGSTLKHKTMLFSEREGWIRVGRKGMPVVKPLVGGNHPAVLQGGFPSPVYFDSPEDELSAKLKAERVALKKQGYVIADGTGSIDWKGRKITGMVFLRRDQPTQPDLIDKVFGARPGDWREDISLCLNNNGTLYLYRQSNPDNPNVEPALGGYLITDSISGPLERVDVKSTAWRKVGFYNMPFAWQGSFQVNGKQIMFRVSSEKLKNLNNLFLKAGRLSVARGFIKIDGNSIPAFGMAEVKHFMQPQKKIQTFEAEHLPSKLDVGMSWETARKN